MKKAAKSNLIVSSRGQVTLPAGLRKKLGIKDGGVVTVEEQEGKLILRPAEIFEIETYKDQEIQEWTKEDQLTPNARKMIRQKLAKGA
ncbi:AbrB/MazE/SpoVT family DNA-binding domain-containing protein [Bdellovibrionota bacterium FG-2]